MGGIGIGLGEQIVEFMLRWPDAGLGYVEAESSQSRCADEHEERGLGLAPLSQVLKPLANQVTARKRAEIAYIHLIAMLPASNPCCEVRVSSCLPILGTRQACPEFNRRDASERKSEIRISKQAPRTETNRNPQNQNLKAAPQTETEPFKIFCFLNI